MPYPNEHAARVAEPLSSDDAIIRRKSIDRGIDIIIQRKKNDPNGSMKTQAYRFDRTVFTADQARQWLKKHKIGYISFEPASSH